MPFKSYAQMSEMKHNQPDIYKRWMKNYGPYSGTKLHIADKQKEDLKRGYKRST